MEIVFCQSKHFLYHSIKTNCLKAQLFILWASLEIPDKDPAIESGVRFLLYFIFKRREFNEKSALVSRKSQRKEMKREVNRQIMDLWNKKCYTHKHCSSSSSEPDSSNICFMMFIGQLTAALNIQECFKIKTWASARSVDADDADYDSFFSPSSFKWFWHHSWIKSTFPWDFLSFLYSCTSSTNLIHQIYLYLLPDDSNQMKSFQIFFYFPASIWIIIYANFCCWIRTFPLHCTREVRQKIFARKWIEFHICHEHLLSTKILSFSIE